MKDYKILAILLMGIGLFGMIGTIIMTEIIGAYVDFSILESWVGMSLLFGATCYLFGVALYNIKKKQLAIQPKLML